MALLTKRTARQLAKAEFVAKAYENRNRNTVENDTPAKRPVSAETSTDTKLEWWHEFN